MGLLRVRSNLHDGGGTSATDNTTARGRDRSSLLAHRTFTGKLLTGQLGELLLVHSHGVSHGAAFNSGQGGAVSGHVPVVLAVDRDC